MNEIIILHGWSSKIEKWSPVIKEFEKKGLKVFFPKLPGFGEKMPAKSFNLDDYSQWLKKYLEEKKLKKAVILGHSFGGWVALKFTSENPKHLSRLILISSSGIKHSNPLKFLFLLISKIGKLIFLIPGISLFRKPARWFFYRLIGEKDYYQANRWQKETLKKILKEHLNQEALEKIKTPVLILWGKKDEVTPIEDAYLLNKKIKNSKLLVLPSASHSLPFEEKEWLVKQVVSFLDESC